MSEAHHQDPENHALQLWKKMHAELEECLIHERRENAELLNTQGEALQEQMELNQELKQEMQLLRDSAADILKVSQEKLELKSEVETLRAQVVLLSPTQEELDAVELHDCTESDEDQYCEFELEVAPRVEHTPLADEQELQCRIRELEDEMRDVKCKLAAEEETRIKAETQQSLIEQRSRALKQEVDAANAAVKVHKRQNEEHKLLEEAKLIEVNAKIVELEGQLASGSSRESMLRNQLAESSEKQEAMGREIKRLQKLLSEADEKHAHEICELRETNAKLQARVRVADDTALQQQQKAAREREKRKSSQETARMEKEEAERKATEQEQERKRVAAKEAERKAARKAEKKAKEEADRKAKEEADRKAKEDIDAVTQKAAEETKAREELETQLAHIKAEEAERRAAQEEAERRAALEEAERKAAQEEAERKAAQEEAERKAAQEEAERRAKEEADRHAKEEADRKAKEEGARRAKEYQDELALHSAHNQSAYQNELDHLHSLEDEQARKQHILQVYEQYPYLGMKNHLKAHGVPDVDVDNCLGKYELFVLASEHDVKFPDNPRKLRKKRLMRHGTLHANVGMNPHA